MSLRKLLVTVLCVFLMLAPAALAATPRPGTYKADNVYQAYDFSFKVVKTDAGLKVTDIVSRLLWNCSHAAPYSDQVTVAPDSSWRVVGGKFSGRKKEVHGKVTDYYTFEGSFTSRSTAKGFLRLERVVAGEVCDTYKRTFTAKRS